MVQSARPALQACTECWWHGRARDTVVLLSGSRRPLPGPGMAVPVWFSITGNGVLRRPRGPSGAPPITQAPTPLLGAGTPPPGYGPARRRRLGRRTAAAGRIWRAGGRRLPGGGGHLALPGQVPGIRVAGVRAVGRNGPWSTIPPAAASRVGRGGRVRAESRTQPDGTTPVPADTRLVVGDGRRAPVTRPTRVARRIVRRALLGRGRKLGAPSRPLASVYPPPRGGWLVEGSAPTSVDSSGGQSHTPFTGAGTRCAHGCLFAHPRGADLWGRPRGEAGVERARPSSAPSTMPEVVAARVFDEGCPAG